MGPNGFGEINENVEFLENFCSINSLILGVFFHINMSRNYWVSSDGDTENKIDHILISQR